MGDHHNNRTCNPLFKDQSSTDKGRKCIFNKNQQNYIRIADSIIDPSVTADSLVHRHCVISTSLHMNQEEHVDHSLNNPDKIN